MLQGHLNPVGRTISQKNPQNIKACKPLYRSTSHPTRDVAAKAKRASRAPSYASEEFEKDNSLEILPSKINSLLGHIQKRFGSGSMMLMDGKVEPVESNPSGCLALDIALGGGYPKGRTVEIFGPESSGKSTLALHAVAEVQKAGGVAVYIDAENAFDKGYAQRLGVRTEQLLICNPDSGELALEMVDELARSKIVTLVVVDSVSALVPKAELEGEIGNMMVGAQARLMSQGLRKLCGSCAASKTTIIFINQLRQKVGVIYGSPETTSGGMALKYFASVRIDVRKKEQITGADGISIGIKVRAKMVKNKCAPPYREAMFDILFGSGIDAIGGMVDAAESINVLVRKGSWYWLGGEKLSNGREKMIATLREDSELCARIEAATRAKIASGDGEIGNPDEMEEGGDGFDQMNPDEEDI